MFCPAYYALRFPGRAAMRRFLLSQKFGSTELCICAYTFDILSGINGDRKGVQNETGALCCAMCNQPAQISNCIHLQLLLRTSSVKVLSLMHESTHKQQQLGRHCKCGLRMSICQFVCCAVLSPICKHTSVITLPRQRDREPAAVAV